MSSIQNFKVTLQFTGDNIEERAGIITDIIMNVCFLFGFTPVVLAEFLIEPNPITIGTFRYTVTGGDDSTASDMLYLMSLIWQIIENTPNINIREHFTKYTITEGDNGEA